MIFLCEQLPFTDNANALHLLCYSGHFVAKRKLLCNLYLLLCCYCLCSSLSATEQRKAMQKVDRGPGSAKFTIQAI